MPAQVKEVPQVTNLLKNTDLTIADQLMVKENWMDS